MDWVCDGCKYAARSMFEKLQTDVSRLAEGVT